MDAEALLRKHNPVLVMLPQDTRRHRPWSRWFRNVTAPRGDYHPCSAEFFLAYVSQRPKPLPWMPLKRSEPEIAQPLGLEALRALVEASRGGTAPWELDLAPIRSQDAEHAWLAYRAMLEASPWEHSAYVYGRFVPGPPAVLEYWYLYAYNDAPNRHEGDWEMVAIELDAAGEPRRAGYAGHSSGFRREWARVEQVEGRPVVYVARGSHAAYFDHKPAGHRANSLPPRKGWPGPLEAVWSRFATRVQDAIVFLRLVDHTSSNPLRPIGEPRDLGELVHPELAVFPDEGASAPRFWWMGLDCRWGSCHARIQGTIGPNPPWRQTDKWEEPAKWIERLVDG